MADPSTIGFIGLGVMGNGICCNLAGKSGKRVIAHDPVPEAVERVREAGAEAAVSVGEVAAAADIVFLSLPGREQVQEVCLGDGGLLGDGSVVHTVVDFSTVPVRETREIARRLADNGIDFADCPVARGREAAAKGTLSIMAGARAEVFERILPFLQSVATDISHCGGVGTGQVLKLTNNLLVFTHVVALGEAMTVGARAGVDPEQLLTILSKGSGDSFVLRNHGMKAMLPRQFPSPAFSSEYVLKDLGYVQELGEDEDVRIGCAELARQYYQAAVDEGFGDEYFPAVLKVIEHGTKAGDNEA